ILALANQGDPAQVVALNFAASDQLIDKLLRDALEQLEFLGQDPDRAFAISIGHDLARLGVADQELEAVTRKVEQFAAFLGRHDIGGACQTSQRAEFAKKSARVTRGGLYPASVCGLVVEVDLTGEDEAQIQFVFTFPADGLAGRKPADAHVHLALERVGERGPLLLREGRENLKVRELLPKLLRRGCDESAAGCHDAPLSPPPWRCQSRPGERPHSTDGVATSLAGNGGFPARALLS